MSLMGVHGIRAIVFDLDGTLYVSDGFAATIQDEAAAYMADLKGIPQEEMRRLMAATRLRLAEESGGAVQTLSAVCSTLGGNIAALHAHFQRHLRPEAYLVRDDRVIELLERLHRRFALYIYTNNNTTVATRIIDYLGLNGCFDRIFAIDDGWLAKPDEVRLGQILTAIGMSPDEVLFVGDRYEVDLRLPEQAGCPIYLSQNVEQLLRLDEVLADRG